MGVSQIRDRPHTQAPRWLHSGKLSEASHNDNRLRPRRIRSGIAEQGTTGGSRERTGTAMSTVNGFGTLYYGWKARPDGTAEATRWIVAALFPVIPLCRHRIRVLNTRDERAVVLPVCWERVRDATPGGRNTPAQLVQNSGDLRQSVPRPAIHSGISLGRPDRRSFAVGEPRIPAGGTLRRSHRHRDGRLPHLLGSGRRVHSGRRIRPSCPREPSRVLGQRGASFPG